MELDFANVANQAFAAVEQLPIDELEQFVNRILALQAKRRAPYLTERKAELLQRINRTLPEGERRRLLELQKKRDLQILSSTEFEELARLSDHFEEVHAERIKALAEWAMIYGISFREVVKRFDIKLLSDD